MELAVALLALAVVAVVALVGLAGVAVILLKLGVIGHHALKPPEPPAQGDYGLEQSHELSDQPRGT